MTPSKLTLFSLAAISALVLVLAKAPAPEASSPNSCVECHTSAGKLINLTRDLHKDTPKVEDKSEGPG
ncbi:hypothetical protein [Dethiosulfatarculus sandiegensis]|uniref:Cytochrome C n=1 Tax=Dethiosulfatarculus sandiegensis TaxID=1429043 RepID=A0A0D2J2Y5_9BACT|nr:hypothetical protein [Dethiosulfatarculus sandiegensis]KIX12504.1 hypothetical protein X474_18770 [Dethiosulfatarculus sandiegensis]